MCIDILFAELCIHSCMFYMISICLSLIEVELFMNY